MLKNWQQLSVFVFAGNIEPARSLFERIILKAILRKRYWPHQTKSRLTLYTIFNPTCVISNFLYSKTKTKGVRKF